MERLRAQLSQEGFATVQQCVDAELLESVDAALTHVLSGPGNSDILLGATGLPRKITYPLAMDRRFLVALAHPSLMRLAIAISPDPEELVLTWEDVLYKPPLTGECVPVHQDHQDLAFQSLGGPVYSLGVHLDDAGANPIFFLPGIHRLGPLTPSEVKALRTTREFVSVAPRAGDVAIHDVLCVHYSVANLAPAPRRTWYLEFRTTRQLAEDGRWPATWARRRRALLFHACAARLALGLTTEWPPLGAGETREQWLAEPFVPRVPHVSHGVEYDLTSPWFHFA
ncbi:MAG: phytanoyl-CoA dioxygenase family protein [Polyangiaceae bacterium]|nr:phytanoyl-CoA dioxygenase family protein [Polyangiaceae bacterium]